MESRFNDRADGGRSLAAALRKYADRNDLLVLGLPRGGVPVAFEIARELKAPLDVFVVRKLGLPEQPELAMGAIASGGVRVLNNEVVEMTGVSEAVIDSVARQEQQELDRREQLYRGDQTSLSPTDRCVLIVDDGLATGATMRAAVAAIRELKPARIVVAVPVGAPQTCTIIEDEVDELVCLRSPDPFVAVGMWYDDFSQTTDGEIRELLEQAKGFAPES